MDEFIGGLGAAFIMAAAAAVIVKFLLEIKVIKSRDNVLTYGKISISAIVIGAVYMSAAALMYNEFHGSTNFFAVDEIFDFLGESSLYYGKYGSVYMLISFALSCVSSCMLYGMISKTASKENTESIMLLLASAPYAFMLFIPILIPLAAALIVSAACVLSRSGIKVKCASDIVRFIENRVIKNAVVFRAVITVFILFNGAALCILTRGI